MDTRKLVSVLKEKFEKKIKAESLDVPFPFLQIDSAVILDVLSFCATEAEMGFDYLENLSVVDTGKEFSIVYQLYSTKFGHYLNLKSNIERNSAKAVSVSTVWPAAIYYEIEAAELFGLVFEGNAEKKHLLLPDDWNGFPLRKDYVFPTEYHGIEHRRVPLRKEHARP